MPTIENEPGDGLAVRMTLVLFIPDWDEDAGEEHPMKDFSGDLERLIYHHFGSLGDKADYNWESI